MREKELTGATDELDASVVEKALVDGAAYWRRRVGHSLQMVEEVTEALVCEHHNRRVLHELQRHVVDDELRFAARLQVDRVRARVEGAVYGTCSIF